jgi:hypothetical protein
LWRLFLGRAKLQHLALTNDCPNLSGLRQRISAIFVSETHLLLVWMSSSACYSNLGSGSASNQINIGTSAGERVLASLPRLCFAGNGDVGRADGGRLNRSQDVRLALMALMAWKEGSKAREEGRNCFILLVTRQQASAITSCRVRDCNRMKYTSCHSAVVQPPREH